MQLIKDLLPNNKTEFEDLLFHAMESSTDTFKIGDKVNIISSGDSGVWEIYKFVSDSNGIAAILLNTESQSKDLSSTFALLDDLTLL